MIMVIPVKVNTLCTMAHLKKVKNNHEIKKITIDSRECIENSIFIAIHGNSKNGEQFIEEAIQKGAKTIVTSSADKKYESINYIIVEDERKTLAILAKYYYKDVSKKLHLVGVIGTNGKTTVSTIAYHFFNYLHLDAMLIGSNGIFYKNHEFSIYNTTPDILTIYHYLTIAKKEKIRYVFMEVSSISVDQMRVYGMNFECLIFTNFSEDHLDYHQTMAKYLYCKIIPFIKLKPSSYAIINQDDEESSKIIKHTDAKVITYGMNQACDYLGTMNYIKETGISFYAKNLLFKSNLIGEFNIYNALSILPLCEIYHIPYVHYVGFLSNFQPVSGRMNRICFDHRCIIIDYAHTYEATKRVILEGLRLCKGKLTILLGCGGNREKEKRGLIGNFLNEVDAEIYLTTDNPRFEEPMDIINDITINIKKDVHVIVDRKEAIAEALKNLKKNDYLLVLGKGCEKYMDIKGIRYPYSDLEVIYDWIRGH